MHNAQWMKARNDVYALVNNEFLKLDGHKSRSRRSTVKGRLFLLNAMFISAEGRRISRPRSSPALGFGLVSASVDAESVRSCCSSSADFCRMEGILEPRRFRTRLTRAARRRSSSIRSYSWRNSSRRRFSLGMDDTEKNKSSSCVHVW